MSKGTVLILGARSDIASDTSHYFAKQGYDIQLAARNVETLSSDKLDIELRYQVVVTLHEFDVLEIGSHEEFIHSLQILPTVAVCAVGYMGEQQGIINDVHAAAHIMRSNYEGPASILSLLAAHFKERGFGTLVGISSVAGDRGRATNYIYGSAKAGFTAFLSGLRNHLSDKNVHVITILPGFVETKMTDGLYLPKMLTAQPIDVAIKIFKSVERKNNVVYVKPIWRFIMLLIKAIPERFFKKMDI